MMRRFMVAVLGLLVAGAAALTVSAAASSSAAAPACTAADLGVWVAISQGSAAAGSAFYPLEFTNLSSHPCWVDGYPGVSALNSAGNQQGSAASRYQVGTPRRVVIAAGATAHAEFVWSDAAVYTAPGCDPTSNVQTLRVYPPGQRSATSAMFSLEVCSRPGATFMSVGPIVSGPGRFPA
jgi:Protein of unknown function (DUF4232)